MTIDPTAMVSRSLRSAMLILAATACASPAQAQDAASVVGEYCLVGVREVGSCIRLSQGGRFEYFLAYGAYDEASEGTWRWVDGGLVVDSLPYDRAPTFAFKRMQQGDAFDVIVESKNGRTIQGVEVSVTCDGRTAQAGVTQAEGYKVDCAGAPTAVHLGLSMFGVQPQAIEVAGRAGADKVYVFEFDPGDLGRKKFAARRLRIKSNDALEMTYADTPIRELEGRPFEYVRSR